MAFTRTPLKASSSPSALVSWMTPAFATAYATVPLETPKPSTEATLTMAPPVPAASIRRAASCAQKNTASRLVPTMRRHSASGRAVELPEAEWRRIVGIVDQDGDGAKRLLGFVECARHRVAVEDVGPDRYGAPARLFDARLHRREPIGAARHQGHRRTFA